MLRIFLNTRRLYKRNMLGFNKKNIKTTVASEEREDKIYCTLY